MKFTIGVLVLYFIYLLFSSPGVIVINTNGEIKGVNNQLRVLIKRKSFWDGQFQKVNEQLEQLNSYQEQINEVKSNTEQQSTENAEMIRQFEKFRLKRIEELEQIKTIIERERLSY